MTRISLSNLIGPVLVCIFLTPVQPIWAQNPCHSMGLVYEFLRRPIVLHTERLEIKTVEPEDEEGVMDILFNKDVLEMSGNMYTPQIVKFLTRPLPARDPIQRRLHLFGIFLNGKLVGTVSLKEKPTGGQGHVTFVGYSLHPLYWGKGYATEAVKEVVRFAFKEKKEHIIYASALKTNTDSINVLSKLGFKPSSLSVSASDDLYHFYLTDTQSQPVQSPWVPQLAPPSATVPN